MGLFWQLPVHLAANHDTISYIMYHGYKDTTGHFHCNPHFTREGRYQAPLAKTAGLDHRIHDPSKGRLYENLMPKMNMHEFAKLDIHTGSTC